MFVTHLCVDLERKNPSSLSACSLMSCDREDSILKTVLTPPLESKAGTSVDGCSHIRDISIWRRTGSGEIMYIVYLVS